MKFKIILPERSIDPKEEEAKKRALIKEDFEKGGLLAKVVVFLYLRKEEPLTVTEVTKDLNSYFGTDVDRVAVFRALNKLNEKGIVVKTNTVSVYQLSNDERTKIHETLLTKYHSFLSTMPKQFRQRYEKINYFWLSNGDGLKYIEWCCELLKFKCKKEQ